jgi:hypothetical protein
MAVIEAIATTYLEADTASVTFSGIPATYEHLQLRINAKSDRSYQVDAIDLNFNSDTGANYSLHYMRGVGSSPSAWGATGVTAGSLYVALTGAPGAARYGTVIADILDYANTNKNTTLMDVEGQTGLTTAGVFSPGVAFTSILWDSTAAVTSIAMAPRNGTNFVRGSEFTLYGLNSA